MGAFVNQKVRNLDMVTAATSGVAFTGVAAGRVVENERVQVYRTKIAIPQDLVYTVTTTSGGGAADAQGQKIATFPEGGVAILGAHFNLSYITSAGVTSTSMVASLGSVVGVDGDAALTTTEADIIASHTLGDGSAVAATLETHSVFKQATGGISVMDGSSTATPVFLNVAGNWIHATLGTGTITIKADSYVTLVWAYMGDD